MSERSLVMRPESKLTHVRAAPVPVRTMFPKPMRCRMRAKSTREKSA